MKLCENLNALQQWESDWLMHFHLHKCQALQITNKRNTIKSTYIIYNHNLQTTDTAKYLGIQRARVKKTYQKQTNVLWRNWLKGTQYIFTDLAWLGATNWRHTGTQTTIARQLDSDDTDIFLGQFWKEERPMNLMTMVTLYVQPYRFEPYLAMSDGVDAN